jgi:hypothetical protein
MIPGLNRFLRRLPHRDRRKGWCIILLRSWKAIRVIPDLIPKSREHLCFDCLASPPRYAGHRSLMDSSLDVRDRQETNRTGCRSRYRRYIMWPIRSLVPGEDSSTGNVTGGRKLARYVLGFCQLYPFNVASSVSAFELLTRFDTGQRSLPTSRCAAW